MRQKKILFITSRVFPVPNANAINSLKIIEELRKRGHLVHCISINQDELIEDGKYQFPIYSIKSTNYGYFLNKKKERKLRFQEKILFYLFLCMRKAKNILNIFHFPDVDPEQSKKAFKLADKLNLKYEYDCVIGVFRPFTSISAIIKMKKKYPSLVCGAYYLDLIHGANKPTMIPSKLYRNLCYRGELKNFKKIDFILMAKGGKEIYSQEKYSAIINKINYIDFPLFDTNLLDNLKINNSKNINVVYAGILDKDYRNPSRFLETMYLLSKSFENLIIHIYGKGNCTDLLEKYQRLGLKIINYGMVSQDKIRDAYSMADFLINISNIEGNVVPSKIFELMSTGKPIISFANNRKENVNYYLCKYPAVKIIFNSLSIEEQLNELKKFIYEEKNKIYDINNLNNIFIENTPQFTTDIIESYLTKSKEF